jgi:hypothetical protein
MGVGRSEKRGSSSVMTSQGFVYRRGIDPANTRGRYLVRMSRKWARAIGHCGPTEWPMEGVPNNRISLVHARPGYLDNGFSIPSNACCNQGRRRQILRGGRATSNSHQQARHCSQGRIRHHRFLLCEIQGAPTRRRSNSHAHILLLYLVGSNRQEALITTNYNNSSP